MSFVLGLNGGALLFSTLKPYDDCDNNNPRDSGFQQVARRVNRLGAVPFFGSIIGGLRIVAGSLGTVVFTVGGVGSLIACKDEVADMMFMSAGVSSAFVIGGLTEVIPFVGTASHLVAQKKLLPKFVKIRTALSHP